MCSAADTVVNSPPMKSVKQKILEKLDCCLPETDVLKLNRVLDPSTKDITPRDEAIALLKQAVERLSNKGLITYQSAPSLNTLESDVEPAWKRRKLKEEMLNELRRSESTTSNKMDDIVMEIIN